MRGKKKKQRNYKTASNELEKYREKEAFRESPEAITLTYISEGQAVSSI